MGAMVLGLPASMLASISALRRAPDRTYAIAAGLISFAEGSIAVGLLVMQLLEQAPVAGP